MWRLLDSSHSPELREADPIHPVVRGGLGRRYNFQGARTLASRVSHGRHSSWLGDIECLWGSQDEPWMAKRRREAEDISHPRPVHFVVTCPRKRRREVADGHRARRRLPVPHHDPLGPGRRLWGRTVRVHSYVAHQAAPPQWPTASASESLAGERLLAPGRHDSFVGLPIRGEDDRPDLGPPGRATPSVTLIEGAKTLASDF